MKEPPKKATRAVLGRTPSAHPARKPGKEARTAPNAMLTTMKGADGTLRMMKLAEKALRPTNLFNRSVTPPPNRSSARAVGPRPSQ
ncbi:hypothetical protein D3C72_2327940 [compost metagenome]